MSQNLGWQGGIESFEVEGWGPFIWCAYDEDILVATGKARTRFGLWWALTRAKRRLS